MDLNASIMDQRLLARLRRRDLPEFLPVQGI